MIKLNDRVENPHGYKGKVTEIFDNFWEIPESDIRDKDQWLEQQEIPFSFSEQYETWYGVECDRAGSILCCESKLTVLEKAV